MSRFLIGRFSVNRRNEVQLIVFYRRPSVADRLRKLRKGNRDRSRDGMPDSIGGNAMLQKQACQDCCGVGVRLQRRSSLAGHVEKDFCWSAVVKMPGCCAIGMALK